MIPGLRPLLEARDSAARYLGARQREDGLIGEPEWGMRSYYKAVWAFAAAGRTREASRLLAWVRRHNFDAASGDFRGQYPRGEGLERVYPYANAWLTIGAQKLGAFDIARRAADFLVTIQDPEGGGFRARLDVAPEEAPRDVLSSSQAGLACLFTGRMGNARFAANFLRTLIDDQPQPESALYFVRQRGRLRTDFEPEHARFFVVRVGEPRQPYFQMGIAASFLCRMSMTSGENAHLETAKRYLEPAFKCGEEMYETAQVGKVGWGAALVYQITGEERYRELAVRVAEALLAQQNADASWDDTGGFSTHAARYEVTAEFIVLLDEIVQALTSR